MVKHTKVTLSRYSHIAPLDIQNEKDRSVHAAGRKCILSIFLLFCNVCLSCPNADVALFSCTGTVNWLIAGSGAAE